MQDDIKDRLDAPNMEQIKPNMADIINKTNQFFKLHWNLEQIEIPHELEWKQHYLNGKIIESSNGPGCYALIENKEVVYIGSGASRGSGPYTDFGIGARLNNHVLRWTGNEDCITQERIYKPLDKWEKITEIQIFKLPIEYSYIAYALEAFLISHLEPRPKANVLRTTSAKK